MFLDDVGEKRRHRRLRPVVGQFVVVETKSQRHGIDYGLCRMVEFIAIVPFDYLVERLFVIDAVRRGERMDVLRKIFQHLLVRVAEKSRRLRMHRPVVEVVEIREDRDLRELAHAREEREALFAFKSLDDGIERLELVTKFYDVVRHKVTKERLVVFVDQDDHKAIDRLVCKIVDDIFKRSRRVFIVAERNAIALAFFGKHFAPTFAKFRHGVGLGAAHVEVQDGPFLRPVPLRLDCKALKILPFAQEEAFEG